MHKRCIVTLQSSYRHREKIREFEKNFQGLWGILQDFVNVSHGICTDPRTLSVDLLS